MPDSHADLTVWANTSALADMIAEAERAHPDETGGMLLGWVNLDRDEIVVTTTVGPGPDGKHHRARFVPDSNWQQQRLEEMYRRTAGKVSYLGDWHVHPEGGFGMSRRDRLTMQATAATPDARCPRPLMGLLARSRDDGSYGFGVWRWRPCWLPLHPGYATSLTVRQWQPTNDEDFWSASRGREVAAPPDEVSF